MVCKLNSWVLTVGIIGKPRAFWLFQKSHILGGGAENGIGQITNVSGLEDPGCRILPSNLRSGCQHEDHVEGIEEAIEAY